MELLVADGAAGDADICVGNWFEKNPGHHTCIIMHQLRPQAVRKKRNTVDIDPMGAAEELLVPARNYAAAWRGIPALSAGRKMLKTVPL